MKLKVRLTVTFSLIPLVPILVFALMLFVVGSPGNRINRSPSEPDKTSESAADRKLNETEEDNILITAPNTEYAINVLDAGRMHSRKIRINLSLGQLFGVIFLVLTLTAVPLAFWFNSGVVAPLSRLKQATQKIKEGNLDFKLEARGQDEIADLCRDFDEMRIRLKESAEEKLLLDSQNMELISNISHDLKTPLTAIQGYVEGLMDGVADKPEKMSRYIRIIYQKSIEMDQLIDELTFYSKIDANRIPYNFEKLPVRVLYESCTKEFAMELSAGNIRFSSVNHVKEDVRIIGDPVQLQRAIRNIISNSVKYADPDKEYCQIDLRFQESANDLQIEIEDNGRGIERKNLSSIFDRFYRSDISRNSSGSGIGLSIVKKIIEDHGGRVWADSTAGLGTVLYLSIRKYDDAAETTK